MNLSGKIIALLMQITFVINSSNGFYIKNTANSIGKKITTNRNIVHKDDEWNVFKQKLDLSDQKVELLKSQKDKEGTLELLNRFIQENPEYNANRDKAADKTYNNKSHDHFSKVYHNLLKQLKRSRGTLKTSLNFEVADHPEKSLKRSRRKIAVKMVSDMSSEKIDEVLKMFNEKHGISQPDEDNENDADTDNLEDDNDYSDFSSNVNPDIDSDYYENEGDLDVPIKSNHNSQYGSLQDLILQANRFQWQKEIEESKLRNHSNKKYFS